ncbi:MAG: 5'-methylthioadenosine/S-adenosylhomocysteine nucleosidase, partial [Paracoccaceae bacterium]
ICGVGPIEAAVSLTRLLAELGPEGRPDLVVSLGSAGSARLEQTAVYQAHSVAWRDMDASAFGFAKGVTPFVDLPATVPLDLRIPGLTLASLSTGANVVSGAGYAGLAEDMVDMETFAILRVCQSFDLPLIALRGISDGAKEVQGMHDWEEYLHIVDENLAHAVKAMITALTQGGLAALRAA